MKRGDTYHGFHIRIRRSTSSAGTVPSIRSRLILAFQPRVSSDSSTPDVARHVSRRGLRLELRVPRPLDFHPDAIPCPYPHSSVDIDEVVYYASGKITSRRGIELGSITLHPAGIPHGPHPGRYEASIGERRTEELAVMLDCEKPLVPTAQARNIEDRGYEASFSAET